MSSHTGVLCRHTTEQLPGHPRLRLGCQGSGLRLVLTLKNHHLRRNWNERGITMLIYYVYTVYVFYEIEGRQLKLNPTIKMDAMKIS